MKIRTEKQNRENIGALESVRYSLSQSKVKINRQRGITLVALVVTIVVLLILAGITLVYVFGDNGIIKLAQDAKERTEQGMQNEQDEIGNLVNMLKEESGSGESGGDDLPPVVATGIKVSPATANVEVGKTQQLTATVEPTNASDKTVTWSSDTPSVATVSNTGLVTGEAKGTATITAMANDGSGVTATCSVRVEEAESNWSEIAEIAKLIAQGEATDETGTVTSTSNSEQATVILNGESKTVQVGEYYRVKYNGELRQVRVLGFMHDDLVKTGVETYGNGAVGNKAGISFEFYDFITGDTYKSMNGSNTNSGGWAATQMRKDLNGYTTNDDAQSGAIGGLGANLSNKSYIKQVKKQYIQNYDDASTNNHYANDYLWLLACSEVVNDGQFTGFYGYAKTTEGSQYKYYQGVTEAWNAESKGRKKYNASGSADNWWLRSPRNSYSSSFCGVGAFGYANGSTNASVSYGVAPGFAI